jgi:hypothetical protein
MADFTTTSPMVCGSFKCSQKHLERNNTVLVDSDFEIS